MNKFRFHFLGMCHTKTSPEWCHCAYTAKVYKAIKMFGRRGHTCIDYSNEGAEVDCEHVDIFSEAERASYFGPHDKQKLYNILWDPSQPYWQEYNRRLVKELRPRVKKGDFLMTLSGGCQVGPVGEAFPGSFSGTQYTAAMVEWGIGYRGACQREAGPWQSRYRVFESHSHREWVMGASNQEWEDNDSAVVNNFFDVDEFPEKPPISERVAKAIDGKPYYLFIGRVIWGKGIDIAVEVCKTLGARLIVAGQGDFTPPDESVVFFGHANVQERAALMTNAIAGLNPTRFREPFGGTAVEFQLCGTPAITTDQGAFCETVERPWRCASHWEFVRAAERAMNLTVSARKGIRARAVDNWSLDTIVLQYERYFQRILNYWGSGWYQETPYVMPEET